MSSLSSSAAKHYRHYTVIIAIIATIPTTSIIVTVTITTNISASITTTLTTHHLLHHYHLHYHLHYHYHVHTPSPTVPPLPSHAHRPLPRAAAQQLQVQSLHRSLRPPHAPHAQPLHGRVVYAGTRGHVCQAVQLLQPQGRESGVYLVAGTYVCRCIHAYVCGRVCMCRYRVYMSACGRLCVRACMCACAYIYWKV